MPDSNNGFSADKVGINEAISFWVGLHERGGKHKWLDEDEVVSMITSKHKFSVEKMKIKKYVFTG